MNIFILDEDPRKAAQMVCDKHVNKMIIESAQMMSTVHRMLDGEAYRAKSASGTQFSKRFFNGFRKFGWGGAKGRGMDVACPGGPDPQKCPRFVSGPSWGF